MPPDCHDFQPIGTAWTTFVEGHQWDISTKWNWNIQADSEEKIFKLWKFCPISDAAATKFLDEI